MTLRVANAAGFLGDDIDAPRRLIEAAEVDVLTLEYLAELTMSVLAYQKQRDPRAGYAADFLYVMEQLAEPLSRQSWKLVTNAGGANPVACARAAAEKLCRRQGAQVQLAMVDGDDVLPRLPALQAEGWEFPHLDTGEPLGERAAQAVNACAYLGAGPLVEALEQGARVVVTGRVADASLTLAPAVQHFGWSWDQWRLLAGGSVAGHLIECGAQVTGGYSTTWEGRCLEDVGYPIVELDSDGDCTVTKPLAAGGLVNRQTVIEQLLYEIGDPAHYLTPDVDVDFTQIEVQTLGPDRVRVGGAQGGPAPDRYKVSLAFHDGYAASAMLVVGGRDCLAKARACADMVWSRLRRAGIELARTHVELLGAGDAAPWGRPASQTLEVVLRLSVSDPRRSAVERFTKEIAPLITSGPAGLGGYATGRSRPRPQFAYWPTTIPKTLLQPRVRVQTAERWSKDKVD